MRAAWIVYAAAVGTAAPAFGSGIGRDVPVPLAEAGTILQGQRAANRPVTTLELPERFDLRGTSTTIDLVPVEPGEAPDWSFDAELVTIDLASIRDRIGPPGAGRVVADQIAAYTPRVRHRRSAFDTSLVLKLDGQEDTPSLRMGGGVARMLNVVPRP